jgi:hypothetical protein
MLTSEWLIVIQTDFMRNPLAILCHCPALGRYGIKIFGCAWLELIDCIRDSVRNVLALALRTGPFEGA